MEIKEVIPNQTTNQTQKTDDLKKADFVICHNTCGKNGTSIMKNVGEMYLIPKPENPYYLIFLGNLKLYAFKNNR